MSNIPAFPINLNPGEIYKGYHEMDGMTLRDYLAAKAMQGIISEGSNKHFESVAENSYRYAEAMLKQMEKCGE